MGMVLAEHLAHRGQGEGPGGGLVQKPQRAQGAHEPVEQASIHVQLSGYTDGTLGASRQGIEHAQLDPWVENLAAPSPENQVDDLCTVVLHNGPLAQEIMPLWIHATYGSLFFPAVPFDRGT